MADFAAFPTGVGMNRLGDEPRSPRSRVPHGRGDEPLGLLLMVWGLMRSPRAWG